MKKLIPVLFVLIGLAVGAAAGVFVPKKEEPEKTDVVECTPPVDHDLATPLESFDTEYVKLNNQFVVPVVSDDLIKSLVVLSLSIEIKEGLAEVVYAVEPKLRDSFLQVLFDYAHLGGFDGAFTNSGNVIRLKEQLYRAAKDILGADVKAVLVVDFVRQDA
jgi:hypothetical protein